MPLPFRPLQPVSLNTAARLRLTRGDMVVRPEDEWSDNYPFHGIPAQPDSENRFDGGYHFHGIPAQPEVHPNGFAATYDRRARLLAGEQVESAEADCNCGQPHLHGHPEFDPSFPFHGIPAQPDVAMGAIQFRITDAATGIDIPTVQLVLINQTTGAIIQQSIAGGALLDVPQGSYLVAVDAVGYVGVGGLTPVPQPVVSFSTVFAALEALPLTANVQVEVRNAQTGLPIAGALVTANGTAATRATDQSGTATVELHASGTASISVTASGFVAGAGSVTATLGQTAFVSVSLTPTGGGGTGTTANLGIHVVDPNSNPVVSASVRLSGVGSFFQTTGADGSTSFAAIPDGAYHLSVIKTGFPEYTADFTLNADRNIVVPLGTSGSGTGGVTSNIGMLALVGGAAVLGVAFLMTQKSDEAAPAA